MVMKKKGRNPLFLFDKNSVQNRILFVSLFFMLIVIMIVIFEFFSHKYGLNVPCLFEKVTGLLCPGCGITRAIRSLFSLDIVKAFEYNMFIVSILPILIICGIDKLIAYIRNKKTFFYDKIPDFFWYSLIIIAVIFCVLRNIEGFEFLRP